MGEKKKDPGLSLAQCVTGNVITWKRTGLWAAVRDEPFYPCYVCMIVVLLFPLPITNSGFHSFHFNTERKGAAGRGNQFDQERSEE